MSSISPANAASAPDFDRLATVYRWMEWLTFGPWLSRCRRTFLDRAAGRRHALVIGDGDGRFTAALLRADPTVQVHAVDASRAMLRALLRRARPNQGRIRTHFVDARHWRPSAECRYDLVVTHFFLDCLTTEEVWILAEIMRPALAEGALWVVSEFDVPPGLFGRLLARPLITFLYWTFGVLTGLRVRHLPDFRGALDRAGFTLIEQRTRLGGLLVCQVWGPSTPPPNVTSVLKSVG